MCATIPILDFEVPRCRIFTEIAAKIPFVAVPKMKVSDLIDIWVGGVVLKRGDIAVRRTANGLGESFFVFLLDN